MPNIEAVGSSGAGRTPPIHRAPLGAHALTPVRVRRPGAARAGAQRALRAG